MQWKLSWNIYLPLTSYFQKIFQKFWKTFFSAKLVSSLIWIISLSYFRFCLCQFENFIVTCMFCNWLGYNFQILPEMGLCEQINPLYCTYLTISYLLFGKKNHVHVNLRLNIVYNHWQNAENSTLRQKLNESYKEAENVQISRAETINRLTRSLEESQKQCQMLLESGSQSYSLLSWWYWHIFRDGTIYP